MTAEAERTGSHRAVILLVDADVLQAERMSAALLRRFGSDWDVLRTGSSDAAVRCLRELMENGRDVALVAVDLELPDRDGVQLLEQAHELCPAAGRMLLVAMDGHGARIPFRLLDRLRNATALGRVDSWMTKDGWISPEEWVYPQIQERLTAWCLQNQPHHEMFRLVAPTSSPSGHVLRDALARNTLSFGFYPVDSSEGQRLIADHGVDVERLPALVLFDGSVLHEPTVRDIAHVLDHQAKLSSDVYDLIVLGAGPAGLAAALYGASEGLQTVVVEPRAIGGQAGTSSMIRNYLGFPLGLTGGDLTFRAWQQALFFGAEFVFGQRAIALVAGETSHLIRLSGGDEIRAHAVIAAIGVDYRRLGIRSLESFFGVGVFYGAAASEARAIEGQCVAVVGGANSAGQAALHLARYATRVDLLVRSDSLEASMSDYLIAQVESAPNIRVRLSTRIVDAYGRGRLEQLALTQVVTGEREVVDVTAAFILIGAQPNTEWLPVEVLRDDRGAILTDVDVPTGASPLRRSPLPYETSVPGVFAVGDVRAGSMKRIAGAVGEGSVACASVHRYLREIDARGSDRRRRVVSAEASSATEGARWTTKEVL